MCDDGLTPLHIACSNGNLGIVSMILKVFIIESYIHVNGSDIIIMCVKSNVWNLSGTGLTSFLNKSKKN